MTPPNFLRSEKPEPFERPKIEVSEAGREWQWVTPNKLNKNDIVAEMGLVDDVVQDPSGSVLLKCRAKSRLITPTTKIFAFTRKIT